MTVKRAKRRTIVDRACTSVLVMPTPERFLRWQPARSRVSVADDTAFHEIVEQQPVLEGRPGDHLQNLAERVRAVDPRQEEAFLRAARQRGEL